MKDPFIKFTEWHDLEIFKSSVRIPMACCLSTAGLDGYPDARFVALKEVVDGQFIFTGSINSRKAKEIEAHNKVALTFWWTSTERQVRIQGTVSRISDSMADVYFNQRNRDSQIVSIVSEQGKSITDLTELSSKFTKIENQFADQQIKRPANWGGYSIKPVRIEFLEFNASRFHNRVLYTLDGAGWKAEFLQP